MLLRILTFFKWVYGNPLAFLVGIRRIPAYHVDYTTGHNHHSAERRTPSLSSGTSRGLCRLSVVTHLLSSHTFTADSLTHTHGPGLLLSSPADGCTPARAMLIKVHPHHVSPNGAIHAEISLPLYLFPLFGALNIIISRQILTSLVKTLFTAQVRWGNNRNIICGSGEVLQRIQKMATYLWSTRLITCLGIYQSISLVFYVSWRYWRAMQVNIANNTS